MTSLTDIYDGDRHHYDDSCRELRVKVQIPHPLIGVLYGDGVVPDTTAGKVCMPKVLWGGYVDARRLAR